MDGLYILSPIQHRCLHFKAISKKSFLYEKMAASLVGYACKTVNAPPSWKINNTLTQSIFPLFLHFQSAQNLGSRVINDDDS